MALVSTAVAVRPVRAAAAPGVTDATATGTRTNPVLRIAGHVVLALAAVAAIFPIYWMFATAFRAPADMLSHSPLPWPISLDNFRYVWHTIPIGSMMLNTFGMAAALAVSQLLLAIFAAYGFAMWSFPGKRLLFMLFVGSWLVPFQVTMIPNYLLVSQLGLLNTVAGVIVPNLCSAFGVMLLRQHLQAFPRDLIDAAQMDGRTSWGTLWRVVLPNLRPALAALGIMLFITAWNEYLWPALVLRKSNALLQIGIRSFLGAEGDNWGAVMAASGIACLPIFLIYLFLQRHVVDAFVRSGLK
ncbi:carbohydrate ABC transporter permease [Nocardia sp. alder85J]|uniref:carbohydrate ABC transporter permease n=1 Tax=Nocardia sp. alder85J TaxID=2862949 RepID=UPI001CD198AC|nr:carbohydrate ABC transporter permease [Nocardia sp. alder85J]MCX4094079.1 carbohydrate ABC transporter permease [Nocardia sp. alder85J]